MSNKYQRQLKRGEQTSKTDFSEEVIDNQEVKNGQFGEVLQIKQKTEHKKKQMSIDQFFCLVFGLFILACLLTILIVVAIQNLFHVEYKFQKPLADVDSQKNNTIKGSSQSKNLEKNLVQASNQIGLQDKVKRLQDQLQIERKQIQQMKLIIKQLVKSSNNTKAELPKDWEENKISQNNKFKFTIRERKKIPQKPINEDRYEFTLSIDKIIEQSNLNKLYQYQNSVWSGIKKAQYQRGIRLMQVTHNVNFKGEFVFDHYNFYSSPEAKAQALFNVLQEEKQNFDDKYEINKYAQDQIGICVYVPSYNNAKNRLYLRNLDSIFQQQYDNYHVVYVNDASTDGTGEYVKAYMEENDIPEEKYVIINNDKNKGNCANIYNAAHNYCKEGEIMVLLDGDDALIGRQVFSLLNAVYQKEKIALTYGQFLLVRQNLISNGFSRIIPEQNLIDGTFRSLKSFYSTHLKTMYVDVFRQIKATDLQYDDGRFYDYASDVAFMTSAIELVGTRLKFIQQVIYEYRFDSGNNDPHYKQVQVDKLIYLKEPQKKMENMSFADNPKTVHYE